MDLGRKNNGYSFIQRRNCNHRIGAGQHQEKNPNYNMTTELILLCTISLASGFIDAIVGGGGLVQTPAALTLLPQYPVATILGTLKIPAFSGSSFAAAQYARKVTINYKRLSIMMA